MMSLRPGSELDSSAEHPRGQPGLSPLIQERLDGSPTSTDEDSSSTSHVSNGQLDSTHCSPPGTENEVRCVASTVRCKVFSCCPLMRVSACSYDRCFISSRKTSGGWRSSCTRRTCGLNSWSWRSKMWGTLKEASKAWCASQKRSCVMNHAAEVRSPSLKSSHFCRNPCRRSQIWFEFKLVTINRKLLGLRSYTADKGPLCSWNPAEGNTFIFLISLRGKLSLYARFVHRNTVQPSWKGFFFFLHFSTMQTCF